MALPTEVADYHREQALIAEKLYKEAASPEAEGEAWSEFKMIARRAIKSALRETSCLLKIPSALQKSSRPILVLRFLMAPPKSQDQFHLLCSEYSKSAENSGNALDHERAEAVGKAFMSWRDSEITSWVAERRAPSRKEIRAVFQHTAPLMAQQKLQTRKRMDASSFQEGTVADMLLDDEWTYQSSTLIDRGKGIPSRHFLRKARFAAGSRTKEIDIAVGLGQSFILAIECKVSNDSTNSTKRLNDIREKAEAWRKEYGRGLKTGGLLQGVYNAAEVLELAEGGVEVFWFHDLPRLMRWIAAEEKT